MPWVCINLFSLIVKFSLSNLTQLNGHKLQLVLLWSLLGLILSLKMMLFSYTIQYTEKNAKEILSDLKCDYKRSSLEILPSLDIILFLEYYAFLGVP